MRKGAKRRLASVLSFLLTGCLLIGSMPVLAAITAESDTVGTSYYVDADGGSDDADGLTPGTAWKSLEKIDQKEFEPGDRVLFKAGTQYHGRFHPLGSGTPEAPITIDIYDGDKIGAEAGTRAAIHGDGKYTHVLFLHNMQHWNINNLEISNQGADHSNQRVGVNVEIDQPGIYSGIHLNNLYVHDVTGTMDGKNRRNGGIYFAINADKASMEGVTMHFNDISVQNCTVRDVSRTGISVGWTAKGPDFNTGYNGIFPQDVLDKYWNTNVVIRNNYVERAGGDGIVPMFCIKPLVEYNVADSCSQNTASNPNAMYNAAIWPWRCEDAVFQFNEAFGTKLNGDGQAYDCDFSRNTLYQYNYSHDNEGGFMLVCQGESYGSVIRYNVSQNDQRCLFMLSNPNEAVFYNNTFYMNGAKIDSGHGGVASMTNNIFYNAGGSAATQSWGANISYDNNLFYGFENTPNDASKLVADPLFVDPGKGGTATPGQMAIGTLGGYQLQAGSPAINAGKVLENNGGRDYAGNALDSTPDIGAFEFIPVDTSELDDLIAACEALNPADYTTESWNNLQTKLDAAKALLQDPNVSQEAVHAMATELQAVVNELIANESSSSSSEEPSSSSEGPSSSSEEPSSSSEEPSSSSEEPSSSSGEPSSSSGEPSSSSGEPSSSSGEPNNSSEGANNSSQEPNSSSQEPGSSSQKPGSSSGTPSKASSNSPSSGSSGNGKDSPKTGAELPLSIVVLMLVSGGVVAITRKRKG